MYAIALCIIHPRFKFGAPRSRIPPSWPLVGRFRVGRGLICTGSLDYFFFFCLPRNLPATTLRNRLWCISVGIPSRTVRRHQHRRPPVDGPFLVAPRRRGIRHRGHTRPETGAGRLERSRSPLQLLHASHARTQRDNVSIRPPCSESRLPRAKISKPQFGFIVFDTYFFLL